MSRRSPRRENPRPFTRQFYESRIRSRIIRNDVLSFLRKLPLLTDAEITLDMPQIVSLRSDLEQLETKIFEQVEKVGVEPTIDMQRQDPTMAAVYGASLLLRLAGEGVVDSTRLIWDFAAQEDDSDVDADSQNQDPRQQYSDLREWIAEQENLFADICDHFDADREHLR